MSMRKVKFHPEPHCPNCGGIHYGSVFCPYAAPYSADDPMGENRGLQNTCGTVNKSGRADVRAQKPGGVE